MVAKGRWDLTWRLKCYFDFSRSCHQFPTVNFKFFNVIIIIYNYWTLLHVIFCHTDTLESISSPPPVALRPSAGYGLLILEVSRSHTTTHHSRQDSSGRVISSSQRPLPDNTQHSRQTSMPLVGFEPTISEGERSQTYALDRAAIATGIFTS